MTITNHNRTKTGAAKAILFRISINLLVFCTLLLAAEVLLRATGAKSLHRMEKENPRWQTRYGNICKKIRQNKLVFFNTFTTGADGIFRLRSGDRVRASGVFRRLRINSEGFRGNEFVKVKTARPRLLLIGDSFTWGASADSFSNSFADLLQQEGYHVYNAGIPGTDPGQYARVAAKYVPRLQPEVTVVCLYLGNDLRAVPHPIKPGANLHFHTNAGLLRGYDENGRYFKNSDTLTRYVNARMCGNCRSITEMLFFRTVIGKGVYRLLHSQRLPAPDPGYGWVREQLQEIARVARRESSRFLVFLIPMVPRAERESHALEQVRHLFEGLEWFFPDSIGTGDYCRPPNRHFNNSGHRKFARFMISKLIETGFPPKRNAGELRP